MILSASVSKDKFPSIPFEINFIENIFPQKAFDYFYSKIMTCSIKSMKGKSQNETKRGIEFPLKTKMIQLLMDKKQLIVFLTIFLISRR